MLRSPIGICDSLHTLDRGLRDVYLSPMYGVPADLPIQPFVAQDLNQICLGRFQIQLHFSAAGSISVEGRWDLALTVFDDSEQYESFSINVEGQPPLYV